MKSLFVTSELFPYNKTGGLGDVCACLPRAIRKAGVDIRYLMPAFPAIIDAFDRLEKVHSFGPGFHAREISVYRGAIRGNPVRFYLVDAPELFLRAGNPYADASGTAWSDNHLRFACLSWVAAEFAKGGVDSFCPDVMHVNDWMTALAPAYVELLRRQGADIRTSTVLTIHNLAFQGIFPYERFSDLGLPNYFFNENGV
jgi:starch synthase